MKIGYPCINLTLKCSSNHTFRIASYSEERLLDSVEKNIDCLWKMLKFNIKHKLFIFRIGSQLVPFASHPISIPARKKWQKLSDFKKLGTFIKENDIRICMHPDQFVILNSKDTALVKKSIDEIEYHCTVLDLMELDQTAKVQIHVGGVYGEKEKSIERFIKTYNKLHKSITKRLVIENDDYRFDISDCLKISNKTGIPVVFDVFHHECNNQGEEIRDALSLASKTWKKSDGVPIVDYSSQDPTKRLGAHTKTIDIENFKGFLKKVSGLEFDLMLEIKDKEKSALKAIKYI